MAYISVLDLEWCIVSQAYFIPCPAEEKGAELNRTSEGKKEAGGSCVHLTLTFVPQKRETA